MSWTCTLASASSRPWIGGALPFPDSCRAAALLAVVGLLVGAGAGGASSDLRGGASAGGEGRARPRSSQGWLQGAGGGEVGWKREGVDEAA